MVRKDGSFIKTQRIEAIKKMIASALNVSPIKTVTYRKVILWCMVEIGLTEARSTEYVDLVLEYQGWVKLDGFIKTEIKD